MESKEALFRRIYQDHLDREAYLDSCPNEIHEFIMDNKYAAITGAQNAALIEHIFGDHSESIYWFLYEWKPGYEVGINGTTTKIHDIDQYIQWMKDHEGL